MATTTINDVADYIIWRSHEAGDVVTHLKLQKLLYYVQAWHLAIKGEALFDGEFEAWVHGPVNPAIYRRFRYLKWSPIDEDIAEPNLPQGAKDHIDEVLGVYSDLSAYQLELLAHREAPWIEARIGLVPDENSSNIIRAATMQGFYGSQLGDG